MSATAMASEKPGRFSGKFKAVKSFAEPPPKPAKPVFDRERAERLMSDAISLLNSFYPDGALEWLRQNRTDVIRHLREAEEAIDAAVFAENADQLTQSLERYVATHRRAFVVFEARPPVIERQEALTL